MRSRGRIAIVAGIVAALALLAYLRDPPWLLQVTSGMAGWEASASGVRYRQMGGRASFFVPADAAALTVPVRAPFYAPDDWPITATFFVDGRTVDRLVLADDRWRTVTIHLRGTPGRKVRRIDIHADRTRSFNRGPLVGELELTLRSR